MKNIVRYNIVEHNGGWLVSDGEGPPRAFLSASEAERVARMDALARTEPTEIHLWRNREWLVIKPAPRAA